MNTQCVIFDMDGLLFDSERIAGEAYKKAAKEFGYIVTDAIRFQLLGRSKKDGQLLMKKQFGEAFPAKEIGKLSAKYKNDYIKEYGLPIKKGLIELLNFLKANKIVTAVASSSNLEVIEWYLKITGIESAFDYIIGGNQVENSKPNPEIFLKVCHHFQISPKSALVLEDSQSGILAAVNGGIPVICIPDLVTHDEEITKMTYRTLSNLQEVINVLETK